MRTIFLIVALLVCVYSWSNESSNHESIVHKNQKSEQQNSDSINVSIDTSSLEKAIRESIKEASEKPDPNAQEKLDSDRKLAEYTGQLADFTKWLVIVTAVLGAVGIWQGYMLKRTNDLGREEFASTHRPIIRVRNFVVRQPIPAHAGKPTLLADGLPVMGQFYISNIGGSDAYVTGIGCWVEVVSKFLHPTPPMERPYEGKMPNIPLRPKLVAGESIPVPFQSEQLLGKDESIGIITGTGGAGNPFFMLYIMGFVEYRDNNDIGRRTAFCRVFDPKERRFVKVQNEDYEHEE